MDQLIFASLSHDHYWYEVGMLKVPAYRKGIVSIIVLYLHDFYRKDFVFLGCSTYLIEDNTSTVQR